MAKVHALTVSFDSGTFADQPGYFEVVETLVTPDRVRHAIGGWDATAEGRLVEQGPLVPGPQVYTYAKAVAITANYPGKAAELAAKRALEVNVEHGDVVEVNGELYIVRSAPNRNITLAPVR